MMIRKMISVILIFVLAAVFFAGCGETVNEIAANVADAAKAELEEQIKAAIEKNKVEVIEMKTLYGKLNDDGSESQFFCAALVKSGSANLPQAAADAVGKLVTEAGVLSQSGSKVESGLLVHKDMVFDHSDFSSGDYYVIFAYHKDLSVNFGK